MGSMVTMETSARPRIDPEMIYKEIKTERLRTRKVYRYRIGRLANAVTILLFGIGVLVFVIGLCTDMVTIPLGFVGWIATWVMAVPLRAYFVRSVPHNEVACEEEVNGDAV
jgi:hypothetical protein